jgi:hypothetical protein
MRIKLCKERVNKIERPDGHFVPGQKDPQPPSAGHNDLRGDGTQCPSPLAIALCETGTESKQVNVSRSSRSVDCASVLPMRAARAPNL